MMKRDGYVEEVYDNYYAPMLIYYQIIVIVIDSLINHIIILY